MNTNTIERDKRIIAVLFIFTIIFTFFGASLAYWNWETAEEQKTNIVFTLTQDFSCAADGGGDITQADAFIAPSTCTNSEHAIQREVTVTPTILRNNLSINMELWLDIDSIDTGLSNSENFKYALTTSSTSCTEGVISSGTFNGTAEGDQVQILNKNYSSSTPQTYYLYVWLDAEETSTTTMNQSFSLSMSGNCTEAEEGASAPEAPTLDEGMIPVTLSSDGTVTTVSETDSNWYDYSNQEWANVVLVNENATDGVDGSQSRSYYQSNLSNNVEVNWNDILAYYVWIPRYKYQIWTTEESSAGSEQTIDIVFESASTPMSLGTAVGEYRTHPAFWWDNDSNVMVDSDETVAGIWVGKFETSTDTSSECYTSESEENCNNSNQSPRILPNVYSLRYQQMRYRFETSQKFNASDNIYGLSNTSTNAHMMKNSEWGAVAYLSHSIYGINDEIQINEYGLTGYSDGEIPYNSESTPQSTTGNITGVFDMSGGIESVMAVMADSSGNPRSGYDASQNSGFNGLLSDDTSYTSGISFPASKYYDLYTSNNSLTACNGGVCYGHALSETANWYSNYAEFVSTSVPWLDRGGYFLDGGDNGVFDYVSGHGNDEFDNLSWRSVLVVGYGA